MKSPCGVGSNQNIFSTREFTKLKQLRLNGHDLFVIVLGGLSRVEKIFWFGHRFAFGFKKDKTISISFCPPSLFLKQSKPDFVSTHTIAPQARADFSLSAEEVSICHSSTVGFSSGSTVSFRISTFSAFAFFNTGPDNLIFSMTLVS